MVWSAPPRPFTYGETQDGIRAVINQIFAPQIIGPTLLEREIVVARLGHTVGDPVARASASRSTPTSSPATEPTTDPTME